MSKAKKLWYLVSVAMLCGLILIWVFFVRGETLDSAGLRVIGCIKSSNANCLMRYVTEQETKALSLDARKLDRFLRLYVNPRMGSMIPVDGPVIEWMTGQRSIIARQRYRDPNGNWGDLAIDVHDSDNGPKVPSLIYQIVNCCVISARGADEHGPRGLEKIRFQARILSGDLSLLRNSGLDGLVMLDQDDGQPIKYSWDEFLQRANTRLKSAENRTLGAS